MSDSAWRPPTDDDRGRTGDDRPDLGDGGVAPEPPAADAVPPSPWSPEGAASWASEAASPSLPPPATGQGPQESPMPDPGATVEADVVPAAEEPPVIEPPVVEPARKRSRAVVLGVVAAVAALGLAGVFAVQRLSDDDTGGASTADELGADLLAAIEAEDVLGVIDTLAPGERDTLGDPFVELVGELQRLEVLSADTDLSRLAGIDVVLTDEQVTPEATNVDDIVNVGLSAGLTVTVDGAALPIGSLVEDQLPDDELTELRGSRVTETDELDLELTAVREGDRWYFSLFHTVAEIARAESGGEPIPAAGVAAAGAESPEAAVDAMLDHVERLDLRGIIAALDPYEAAALQRYAPLFLDEAEAELSQVPLEWRIDTREFRVEGDGAERTVFVDALGISGEIEGTPFEVGFADGCLRAEAEGESFEQCTADGGEQLDTLVEDAPAVAALLTALEESFSDLEPIGIELRERDGDWYVSPIATGTEALLAVLRALDRSELDLLVDAATVAAEEFVDVVLGGLGLGGEFDAEEWGDAWDDELGGGFDEGSDEGSDDGFEEGVDGDVDEDVEAPATAWDECYGEESAADAAACFERYVASGEIDPVEVPTALRFPECGLAELSWGGFYDATDAEFAAALDAAAPCFADLVARGEIEDWMLPFEIEHAECFEGRNWYTEFEDDAYNDRVDACIFGAD